MNWKAALASLLSPFGEDFETFSSIESAQEKVSNNAHSQVLNKSFLYRRKQNEPDNAVPSFPQTVLLECNSSGTHILAADSIIIYQISNVKTTLIWFDYNLIQGSWKITGIHPLNVRGTGSNPEQCSAWNNIQRISPVLIIWHRFRVYQSFMVKYSCSLLLYQISTKCLTLKEYKSTMCTTKESCH